MFVDDDRSDVRLSATGMVIQRLTMSQEIVISGYGSPVFHWHFEKRDNLDVTLMLKGGGSENMGIQYSLLLSSCAKKLMTF